MLPSYLGNKYHCECLSSSNEGRQNMQTYTAHFVAPKPYVPLQHILSPGVKLCMGATKCAVTGHLYSMKLIDSPACSCGFINENEFHFFLVCPLYNRPRVTLQNAMGNIAPFTLRTLLYGSENLDLTVNKRIVTETLRFIKDSKRFDPWLHDSVLCRVHVLTVCFVIRCKYLICHHLIDVHLYKFFTFWISIKHV